MNKNKPARSIALTPIDNNRLTTLCGAFNENLLLIEKHLGIEITCRGNEFHIFGIPTSVDKACELIQQLYQQTEHCQSLDPQSIQLLLKSIDTQTPADQNKLNSIQISGYHGTVKPRTSNQYHYMRSISKFDINFGVGPSGTGKTFLAIACATDALQKEEVSRIILVRPAVEAGEKLGFLPGDLADKIDPYLRPLYDALHHMLGSNKVASLMEKNIIEIAPLAYMRGRTLDDAFIILDEAQNTTQEQMKMFLTRLGFGSKAVITGDITQTDLPKASISGLRQSINILRNIDEIHFTFFKSEDVLRHPLVQKIVQAYDKSSEEYEHEY